MGPGSPQNGLQLLAAIGRSFPDDAQSSGGMVRCRTSWSWPCILRFNKLFNISINRDEITCIYIYIWNYIYGLVFCVPTPQMYGSPGSTPFPSICKLLAAFLRSNPIFARFLRHFWLPASHLLGTRYLLDDLRSTNTPSKYPRATYSHVYMCYLLPVCSTCVWHIFPAYQGFTTHMLLYRTCELPVYDLTTVCTITPPTPLVLTTIITAPYIPKPTSPTMHTIQTIHALLWYTYHTYHTNLTIHTIPIIPIIHSTRTIHMKHNYRTYHTYNTKHTCHNIKHTTHTKHTVHEIITYHTHHTHHAIFCHSYTTRPRTTHPPPHHRGEGTVPHPHHTTWGGGGQYYGWPMTMAPEVGTLDHMGMSENGVYLQWNSNFS